MQGTSTAWMIATTKQGEIMIILKLMGKLFCWTFMAAIYMMVFPLWLIGKLLFWWLPTVNDGNDEWQFWKEHGHNW